MSARAGKLAGKTQLRVGTSGWTYDDWAGTFYPPEVKAADRLSYYAERFNTVEINATFYRLPTETMIGAWNRRLPEGFHLVVKGWRAITHLRKLAECSQPLDEFFGRVGQLARLQVVLWQLPPSLHKDTRRLEEFLALLPQQWRYAVEFRHASWWDAETAQVLREHRAALAAISHPRLPEDVLPTTDFLYVRFHGLGRQLYRYDYSDAELQQWVDRLMPHLPGRTLYAFFNNDFQANAPRNAERFRQLLLQRLGHSAAR